MRYLVCFLLAGCADTVTVDRDERVPALSPPTELNVRGLTEAECADAGGRFSVDVCFDVDY